MVRTISQGFDRKNLMDIHPIAFETVGATSEIDAPDTQRLIRNIACGLLQLLLEVMAPVLQSARIMQTQPFHIQHLEALLAHTGDGHGQMGQLAMGEHVAADELAGTLTHLTAIHVPGCNAMVHHQATGLDLVIQDTEIAVQVGVADVFEHTDADHLVELLLARQIAIVSQLQPNMFGQPCGFAALLGQIQLGLTQGDTANLYPIVFRRMTGQAAPATSHIEQPLPGFQPKFAAQVIQLLRLCSRQRVFRGVKVTAGIHHLRIQPEGIEVVGQIVVIGDRFGIHLPIVLGALQRRGRRVLEQALAEPVSNFDDIHDIALDVQTAVYVGFPELVQGRLLHFLQQGQIIDLQGNPGILGQIQRRTALDDHPQRQLKSSQRFGKLRKHPPISCAQ